MHKETHTHTHTTTQADGGLWSHAMIKVLVVLNEDPWTLTCYPEDYVEVHSIVPKALCTRCRASCTLHTLACTRDTARTRITVQ